MKWRFAVGTVVLAAAALAAYGQGAPSAQRPMWGNLKPGPYEVGFRVIHTVDAARSYIPRVDFRGQRAAGETARPLQISIWYPARILPNARPMPWGAYLDVYAASRGDNPAFAGDRELLDREMRAYPPLRPFFPQGMTEQDMARIRATSTGAYRDAAAVAGRFPLVIHAFRGTNDQSIFLEFLASHGYVVATLPLLGRSPAFFDRGEWSISSLEEMADDIAHAYRTAVTLPQVDPTAVAASGFGGAPLVLFQMRSMRLDALAVIEGILDAGLSRTPAWDVARMRVPMLTITSREAGPDAGDVSAFRYATCHAVKLNTMTHAESYPFPRIARPERAAEQRATICPQRMPCISSTPT